MNFTKSNIFYAWIYLYNTTYLPIFALVKALLKLLLNELGREIVKIYFSHHYLPLPTGIFYFTKKGNAGLVPPCTGTFSNSWHVITQDAVISWKCSQETWAELEKFLNRGTKQKFVKTFPVNHPISAGKGNKNKFKIVVSIAAWRYTFDLSSNANSNKER